jgi:uncharacterized protein YceK
MMVSANALSLAIQFFGGCGTCCSLLNFTYQHHTLSPQTQQLKRQYKQSCVSSFAAVWV